MAITAAEKVLIAGGMLNLAYGTLLGYPITVIRVVDGEGEQGAAARSYTCLRPGAGWECSAISDPGGVHVRPEPWTYVT